MKKLTAILAGATALVAVSTSAQAAPVIVYSATTGGFSAGFFDVLSRSSFKDTFASFTVDANSAGNTLTGALTSSSSITFTTAALYQGTTLISSFTNGTLAPVKLAEGTYFLKFAGTDKLPASYAGTLNFTAAPEPAAWSLMILGFGAVGFAMRRQRATYRVAYN